MPPWRAQDVESTSYNVAVKWLLDEPDVDTATIRKRAEALSRISDIFGVRHPGNLAAVGGYHCHIRHLAAHCVPINRYTCTRLCGLLRKQERTHVLLRLDACVLLLQYGSRNRAPAYQAVL